MAAGYQMDRRCGNTNDLGAIFGVLSAIGVPVPKPGSIGFNIAQTVNRVQTAISCAPRPHRRCADPVPRLAGLEAHVRGAAPNSELRASAWASFVATDLYFVIA